MTYFHKLFGVNFKIVIGGFSLKPGGGKSFDGETKESLVLTLQAFYCKSAFLPRGIFVKGSGLLVFRGCKSMEKS